MQLHLLNVESCSGASVQYRIATVAKSDGLPSGERPEDRQVHASGLRLIWPAFPKQKPEDFQVGCRSQRKR